MGTQYDGGAVTDSTENTAGVIGFDNSAVTDFKVVIVFETTVETAIPSPISTAFTAPIDMTALERFASSFSKQDHRFRQELR